MRKLRSSMIATAVLAVSVLAAGGVLWAQTKPTEPTVDRTSIILRPMRIDAWVGTKQVWKWYPRIEFRVNGPISAGSRLTIEYSFPNKSWMSYACPVAELGSDGFVNIQGGDDRGKYESKATTYTGYVNFTIGMKNELEGTNKTLFTGKFKASKNTGKVQAMYMYYIDYDWTMPIGLLTYPVLEVDVDWRACRSARPMIHMWFPTNGKEQETPVAYLYFNGKKISSSERADQGGYTVPVEIGLSEEGRCYRSYCFEFGKVLVFDREPSSVDTSAFFHLEKNPGEYEIKVLWNGKLVRTGKFTVGADGRIVDGGAAARETLKTWNFQPMDPKYWSDIVIVVPLKVLGNNGFPCNADAWKTDAFWGNPIKGFAPPQ
jgi:hypothetical protein